MQSNHQPPTAHSDHKPGKVIVPSECEKCHMTHTREGIT